MAAGQVGFITSLADWLIGWNNNLEKIKLETGPNEIGLWALAPPV